MLSRICFKIVLEELGKEEWREYVWHKLGYVLVIIEAEWCICGGSLYYCLLFCMFEIFHNKTETIYIMSHCSAKVTINN